MTKQITPPTPVATLPEPYSITGVGVHPVRLSQMLGWISSRICAGARATVMYANAYTVNLAHRDPGFRAALAAADLVFCDGHGVRLASRLLGRPLPERFTGPDWIEALASLARDRGYRVFLLGSEEGIATTCAARLRATFPGLDIDGHHGYFALEGDENERVLDLLAERRPDILLVGMGTPRQERWALENRERHDVPIVIVVGALFDYVAGRRVRGPRWLTDRGLEWLCRLLSEPRRLWRRYLIGNPAFVGRVLGQWVRERRSN